MKCLIIALSTITLCNLTAGFTNVYPKLKTYYLQKNVDVGNPLFLTPLIESGKLDKARRLATVEHNQLKDVSSYSGYFTVNKNYGSNLFFWFFPSQNDPRNAPVILWLQGGPGATSWFGLFTENGPFIVTKNITLKSRLYSWTLNHSVIYIDNPVGTGYSFTENDLGYANNENDVGQDLLAALVQFFKLFPELRKNEFFAAGEGYAGKYVPAVSHAIKNYNTKAKEKINLRGLAIGNGLLDPYNQLVYSDDLYQNGLLDLNGLDQFKKLEDEARDLLKQKKYVQAYEKFKKLIGSDLKTEPSLFKNLTGFDFYFNFLQSQVNNSDYFSRWIQKPDVRKAIHVGNCSFNVESNNVKECLKEDILQPATSYISDLLQYYKVLIYHGQLDIILPYASTEKYLQYLNWLGAKDYRKASRKQWRVGKDLAGYSKKAGNLMEVLVRNAGHMVPADQPMWAWNLITSFTHHKKI